MDDIMEEKQIDAAKEGVRILEKTTPVSNNDSKLGHLKDHWGYSVDNYKGGSATTIGAVKKWQIVHLLEDGTINMSARPILGPMFDIISVKYFNDLQNLDVNKYIKTTYKKIN